MAAAKQLWATGGRFPPSIAMPSESELKEAEARELETSNNSLKYAIYFYFKMTIGKLAIFVGYITK